MRYKQKIKINYSDFWLGFNKDNNFFNDLLSKNYDIELSDNPDFLIYSCYSKDYLAYDCIRILYLAENQRPDFSGCDFAFTFDYNNDPRHFRLPLYALYGDVNKLIKNISRDEAKEILKSKTGFCNMVVSNARRCKRIEFFKKLSSYKKIDSGGRYLNNIGEPVKNKIEFVKDYKFTFAFENSSYPGYTTEKVFEPMLVNSIPIYWGNPLVGKDFNTKSFINYHDYNNDKKVMDRIIEVDQNDDLYLEMLMQPWYNDNRPNSSVINQNILNKLDYIISQKDKIKPVAQSKKKYLHFVKSKKMYLIDKAKIKIDYLLNQYEI